MPSGVTDTFSYNGLGLRVGKADSTGSYSYLTDGTSPGSAVLSDGHATYTPGLSENRAGVSGYYSNDKMGNLWTLDGTSKNRLTYQDFSGFGSLVAGSGGQVFGFGGGNGCQSDADTGLVLMGHRYYDSRQGRFISQDPAGDGDNWYAYAGNSPTNEVDPSGLDQAPSGISQEEWDRGEDERNQNYADMEEYLSEQYPDATIQYDHFEMPFVQFGSETICAVSDGNFSSDGGSMQSADDMLTGGMDTKAVAAARSGNYGAAGAYFAGGVAAVFMTIDSGGEDEGAFLAIKNIKTLKSYLNPRFILPRGDEATFIAKGDKIGDMKRLLDTYPGSMAKNWSKMKNYIPSTEPGKFSNIEIHWYENEADNIGKVEFKSKL